MPRGEGLKKTQIRPDENLSRIIGEEQIPITEAMKKFWTYAKDNKLIVKT